MADDRSSGIVCPSTISHRSSAIRHPSSVIGHPSSVIPKRELPEPPKEPILEWRPIHVPFPLVLPARGPPRRPARRRGPGGGWPVAVQRQRPRRLGGGGGIGVHQGRRDAPGLDGQGWDDP